MHKLLSRIRGAIFDLDGTLIDSMGVWEQVDIDFLARYGIACDASYTRAVGSMHYEEAARYTIERYGLQLTEQQVLDMWMDMAIQAYGNTIELKPHARALLENCREHGIPIALATASPAVLYEPVLKRHGLRDWFDAIVTTADVTRGKGFPDIYLLAAQKLDVPPAQCAVFEDILQGIRGAKAAGAVTVAVYDAAAKEDWPQMQWEADYALCDFAELLGKR